MNWVPKTAKMYVPLLMPVILFTGWLAVRNHQLRQNAAPFQLSDYTCKPNLGGILGLTDSIDLSPNLSLLDRVLPAERSRAALMSRLGLTKRPAIDWKQFPDVLATHEIALKSHNDELANVLLAAQAVDYSIVKGGQVFSFNAEVGERSLERGFVPGLMYSNGQVVYGVGGGICIVSTAIFEAALRVGCTIVERSQHSGPVRYADPGLDAAVVYGHLDLQFRNDSDTPILLRCRVESDRLIVTFLGVKEPGVEVSIVQKEYEELPFRIVEIEDATVSEGSVRVQSPGRTGYIVTIVRYIRKNGKLVDREVVSTDLMQPKDKIVLVPISSKVGHSAAAKANHTPNDFDKGRQSGLVRENQPSAAAEELSVYDEQPQQSDSLPPVEVSLQINNKN